MTSLYFSDVGIWGVSPKIKRNLLRVAKQLLQNQDILSINQAKNKKGDEESGNVLVHMVLSFHIKMHAQTYKCGMNSHLLMGGLVTFCAMAVKSVERWQEVLMN